MRFLTALILVVFVSQCGAAWKSNRFTTNDVPRIGINFLTDFGPVGAASDSATFQSANNRVFTNGGGKIEIPAGFYTISNTVFLSNGVSFVGSGATLKLHPSVTAGTLIRFPPNASNITIAGINLSGGFAPATCCTSINPDSTPIGTRTGIVLNVDAPVSAIHDCRISGFSGNGIWTFSDSDSGTTYHNSKISFRDVECFSNANAFYFDSGNDASHLSEYFNPSQLYAHDNTIGFLLNCANLALTGCRATANNIGVYVGFANGHNSGHGTWVGGSINHNNCQVYGYVATSGWIFTGVYFNSGTSLYAADIYMINCQRMSFNDCSFNIGSISCVGTAGQQPNYIRNCTYNGLWSALTITNSANLTFGGNVSFSNFGDSDGTVAFTTNSLSGMTALVSAFGNTNGQPRIWSGLTNSPTFPASAGDLYISTGAGTAGTTYVHTNSSIAASWYPVKLN